MTPEHFMRDDLVGVALATVMLAALLIPPGYLFGWLFDLFDFRGETLAWQVLLALPLSIALVPILEFLLWTYTSVAFVWTFHALAAVFFLLLAARGPKISIPAWVVWTALAWMAIVWISGIDLQFGNRLYPSVIAYDFNMRAALIDGIARRGMPAVNALFFPGQPVPLRYHYFWFLPCALIDRTWGRRCPPVVMR